MVDAKALRYEMMDHNCSVSELAKVCGISRSALYRRLNGEVDFTLGEILKCSERLRLSSARWQYIFIYSGEYAKRTLS